MKVLVTGGAGFIGSHIVDAYIEQGHEVTVIDDLSTGRRENLNPRAKFFHIAIENPEVTRVFEQGQFDVLNHHAAQMDVRRSVIDPAYDARINVLGMINLLQEAVRTNVRRVVFASTGGAIYGEQDYFPADEDHPNRPLSPYGITKLAGEKYLFFYKEVHGLDHTILRYSNVYGPRQNPHGEAGVVAIFCSRMLSGESPTINGDGQQTRDYVYVGDVVKANVLALEQQNCDTFNIGTGVESDVNTLFFKLRAHLGADMEEVHGPAKPGEQLRSLLDAGKAIRELGWRPTVDLESGLERTLEHFRSQRA